MLVCLEAMYLLPACVFLSWRLAEIPVNELVTCISRLVPRYFCLTTVSYLLLAPPPTPLFILPMFSSLFVYIHSGWKSQTQEDAARNKAALSLSSAFPFLFFLTEMQPTGHALGFQTSVCIGGPWRVTPP